MSNGAIILTGIGILAAAGGILLWLLYQFTEAEQEAEERLDSQD